MFTECRFPFETCSELSQLLTAYCVAAFSNSAVTSLFPGAVGMHTCLLVCMLYVMVYCYPYMSTEDFSTNVSLFCGKTFLVPSAVCFYKRSERNRQDQDGRCLANWNVTADPCLLLWTRLWLGKRELVFVIGSATQLPVTSPSGPFTNQCSWYCGDYS